MGDLEVEAGGLEIAGELAEREKKEELTVVRGSRGGGPWDETVGEGDEMASQSSSTVTTERRSGVSCGVDPIVALRCRFDATILEDGTRRVRPSSTDSRARGDGGGGG